MPESVDVVIIGGGPGGLFLAGRLARDGVSTVVFEEHPRVGDPVHCTGVLSSESFSEFDLPDTATLNQLTRVRLVSPGGIAVEHSTQAPLATVIDRPVFDRALADRAIAAGADVRCGVRVRSLTVERDRVDVTLTGAGSNCEAPRITGRLAVLACGANYTFQRRLGLGLPRAYLHTAQRELPAERLGDVELYFGRDVAPDGFAWAVPVDRPEGPHVRIGVMASGDAPSCYQRVVDRVRERWGVADNAGAPRQKVLPLGAIDRTYADRVLAVGDAAGLVKPTTGGGIHYSIVSAALAASVAVDALRRDALDALSLASYEDAWRTCLADEFEAQHALRDVATRLSDAAIDDFFELARTDGVMPIVRATARFNEHRTLIRALFKHPPARRVLFGALVG